MSNHAKSGKKIRQQQQKEIQPTKDKTPIHSGSFMVTFTEQNEDSYDMPIASPDAANYEVPVVPAKHDESSINKEKNNSLKNLIKYLTTAYSPNLTSPKWKNFKGLKLNVKDKIRLNNVIWRTWFQECNFL
jgi:MAX-like protein X